MKTLNDLIRDNLVEVLKEFEGSITNSAHYLGVTRMTVYRWIAQYGINIEDFRKQREIE